MTIALIIFLAVAALALTIRRPRWRLLLALAALIVLVPGRAFAADGETLERVQLSALTVSLIIGLLIPIVTGLVTKYSTSSGLKGLITLMLNAVQTLVVTATVADGTAIISRETFVNFCLALVISVASYAGVYRPLGVTSSTQDGALAGVGRKD